ncbi:hypothetical protein ACVBEF_04660 [Glaciimonas sp. GG7]
MNVRKKDSERPKTIGITLRPELELLAHYEEIALRANRMFLTKGERGNVSAQQVMLQRMRSLPSWQARLKKKIEEIPRTEPDWEGV